MMDFQYHERRFYRRRTESPQPSQAELLHRRLSQPPQKHDGLRIILTAKDVDEWNIAKSLGYKLIRERSFDNARIGCFVWTMVDNATGDYFQSALPWSPHGEVFDKTFVRVAPPTPPFCAYVIPPDLTVGEVVWLDYVIQDLVHYVTPEGCQKRLNSCKATWTGERFLLSHIEPPDRPVLIG